jgi:heterodisulfide reductase subunit A2
MKVGVYFCNCGTNVSEKIDSAKVREQLHMPDAEIHYQVVDFLCSEDGKEAFVKDLRDNKVDRVVIGACSPRELELMFMGQISEAGLNPYMMQMANIREQVAWVTKDPQEATAKAARQIRAAMRRVVLHDPLTPSFADMVSDVLVIGAGPAGIKAALAFAEAGRTVTLVEKTAAIGGAPVRYEEVFPKMECAPCMLEPPMGELLHGPHHEKIDLLTLAEVEDVVGFFGNYTITIRQQPRSVDAHKCIGCYECVAPCPVSFTNDVNYGRDERKAMSFLYAGALPNAPFIDQERCLRSSGQDCTLCRDACPVEDTVLLGDTEKVIERKVGAIVLATGAEEFDVKRIPQLAYGTNKDVYTGLEFERILSSTGPTGGELKTASGATPASIAIVHCVGSLDERHCEYCSGVCCSTAFKFNHLIQKKVPGAKVIHLYKEIAVPGKEDFELYDHARHAPTSSFVRYANIDEIRVAANGAGTEVVFTPAGKDEQHIKADMVVLSTAVVPRTSSKALGELMEVGTDRFGFFKDLHDRIDAGKSAVKGVYLAGACHSPQNIQQAVNQSMAATGYVLSGLVEGKRLEISPVVARVDQDRCSGCHVCVPVCPYRAIGFDDARDVSLVNAILCQGCGTCVAACPTGAMQGDHFTDAMIMAEIDEVLR